MRKPRWRRRKHTNSLSVPEAGAVEGLDLADTASQKGRDRHIRRAVLIVEDDAELRSLTAALFEDEQVETIECESAEAALATLLIGGPEVAMIFADVRLRGVMDGMDLAREVKMRWPLLPVILTSGHPCERVGELPPGVAYMPKPWQPLNVLIAAERALASRV